MKPESGAFVHTLPEVLNLGPHKRGGSEDFVQFPYDCIMPCLTLVSWS